MVSATEGANSPGAVAVQVMAFRGDQSVGSWHALADDSGRYRVDGVARIEGADYALGTDYGGVAYLDRLDITGRDPIQADVTVYESVTVDPGIRFERGAWILSGLDPEHQTVKMLEVYGLVNPTDRAFVPGAGGPSGLLVFPLPAHATDLTAHLGLDPSSIAQIDQGFASLDPIRPGRTEIAFSYEFPYAEASYLLSRTVRYPTDSLHFLVPQPGPAVQGDGWQDDGIVAVGGIRYQELEIGPLDPGTRIGVTLAGLPVRAPGLPAPPPLAVAIGGAAVGLAVIVLAYRRRPVAAPGPAADDTLEQLAQLEEDRAAGRVGDGAYQAARAALLTELRPDDAPRPLGESLS